MNWEEVDAFMKHKRHYFWSGFMRAFRWVLPLSVRETAFEVFAAISPQVPTNLRNLSTGSNGWRVFGSGFLIGLVVCFGITALLAVLTGTWDGPDANMVYFRKDLVNIFLYLFVCPLYIGLCAWIISLFLGRSQEIQGLAEDVRGIRFRFAQVRFPLSLGIMLSLAGLLIFKYIHDILQVTNVPQGYWFMTAVIDGKRYLNGVGAYYVMLNFGLLLLTLMAIASFFALFFDTLRVGWGLANSPQLQRHEFSAMMRRLEVFTEAYLVAKVVCVVYIVNIVVWRISPLGATTNVAIASAAVAAMGLFFISFPRYYVEIAWREYQRKTQQPVMAFEDIRKPHQRVIVTVIDTFFLSTFVLNYASLGTKQRMLETLQGWMGEILKGIGIMN